MSSAINIRHQGIRNYIHIETRLSHSMQLRIPSGTGVHSNLALNATILQQTKKLTSWHRKSA